MDPSIRIYNRIITLCIPDCVSLVRVDDSSGCERVDGRRVQHPWRHLADERKWSVAGLEVGQARVRKGQPPDEVDAGCEDIVVAVVSELASVVDRCPCRVVPLVVILILAPGRTG